MRKLLALIDAFIGRRAPGGTVDEVVQLGNGTVTRLIEEWKAAKQQEWEMELGEMLRLAACAERYQRGEAEWVS